MRVCSPFVAIVLIAWSHAETVQEPSPERLSRLLKLASDYVTTQERSLTNVVAEERYVQEVLPAPEIQHRLSQRTPRPQRRTLVSDFLLVKVEAGSALVPFRDVISVDGRSVSDRSGRLTNLFLRGAPNAARQAEQITQESARYNIGVQRTFNVPVLALTIVEAIHRPRFHFKLRDAGNPTAWVVDYSEYGHPMLVRGSDGNDLPLTGRVKIDPATGAVMESALEFHDRQVTRGTASSVYGLDPKLGVNVPLEMNESYDTQDHVRSTGKAAYSNFRHFEVITGPSRQPRGHPSMMR